MEVYVVELVANPGAFSPTRTAYSGNPQVAGTDSIRLSAHVRATEQAGRGRRTATMRIRAIEYCLRSVPVSEHAVTGYARYVGRVGALALALGIGSAVASMPIAFADTTGSGGSAGSGSVDTPGSASATTAVAPRRSGRGSSPSVVSPATRSGGQVSGSRAATGHRAPVSRSVIPPSAKAFPMSSKSIPTPNFLN